MKIIVNGANGYMGRLVVSQGETLGHEVVAKIDREGEGCLSSIDLYKGPADAVIDFSHHTAAKAVTDFCLNRKIALVMATTGQTEEEDAYIRAAASKIPLFYSANMSLGVAVLVRLAQKTAALFPDADIEIVEQHHNRKIDAPSGTALMIAEGIKKVKTDAEIVCGRSGRAKREKNQIGIASLRLGNVVGIHEVYVSTPYQTLTLKHEAHTREVLAEGSIVAAEYLIKQPIGFYDMFTMLGDKI